MGKQVLRVTSHQVAVAKMLVAYSEKLGRQIPPEIVAIANAKRGG